MISNKHGLDIFYTAFKEAASSEEVETGHYKEDPQPLLERDNYYLCLEYLARAIYSDAQ